MRLCARHSVFAVNKGTIEPARVSGGQVVSLPIDGREVQARQYRVESARTRAHIWLSQTCVPVRMDVIISGANISLILTHETDTP